MKLQYIILAKKSSNIKGSFQRIVNAIITSVSNSSLKLSTMIGENFEIYSSQMAKNALTLSTMVGEMF